MRGLKPEEKAEEKASMEIVREVKKRLPAWREEQIRLAHAKFLADKKCRLLGMMERGAM